MEMAKRMIRSSAILFILFVFTGIYPLPTSAQESAIQIIDNTSTSAEIIGQWQTSTWPDGGAFYGQNYIHDLNQNKGQKSVRFRPVLTAGNYAVHLRYTASSNRADNVPVELIHAGDTTSFAVNQRQGGGQWRPLGTYAFAGDGNEYLEIKTQGTNGYVIADAAAFVPVTQGTPCLEGLLAYWNMDQTDAVVLDLAGADIGWVNGAVSAPGQVGNALSFDGNDAILVSDAENLRLSAAFTLSAWVRETTRGNFSKVISRRSGNYFYFLGIENGKPYAGIGDGTAFTTSNKTFSLPLGQWHHLAAVYDNAADRLWMYFDGELQEEITMIRELPYKTGVSLSIGADNEGAAYFFTGLIDEVAVFNNALDADQIHALYVKGLNGRDYCSEDLCGNGEIDAGEDCDGDPECPGNCRYGACYADQVVSYNPSLRKDGHPVLAERTNPENALGSPEGNDTVNFVSLGFGGELILEFDSEIVNREGADIKLTETTYNSSSCATYPETVRVYASTDGVDWTDLGTGCQDSLFDLGSLDFARYLKLVDESDPTHFSSIDDGFDVDGVKILSCRSVSLPIEVSLHAEPNTINSGDASILTWASVNAETVEIGGIGPVGWNGSVEVSPMETTTYTITATGPGGEKVATATVTVNSLNPPPTVSLSATPSIINVGEEIELTWSVENAETIIGEQTDSYGSMPFDIPASGTEIFPLFETTTFTVTATGPGGTTSKRATVNVILPPPTICISASPETIVFGGSCNLEWGVEYATSVSIDNGIGDVPEYGYLEISPTETTTYTITATGAGGTTSESVTVNVSLPPPPIASISVYPESIVSGQSCELAWAVEYATSVSIDNGIGDVTEYGYLEISPTETTTYTITASNPGGTSSASTIITVISPITLQITSPLNNESISSQYVMVQGTITNSTGNETGVMVDGMAALEYEGQFIINHLPLTEGANTIAVVATDSAGVQVSQEITISADFPSDYIRLDASQEAGILPLGSGEGPPPLEIELYVSGSFSLTSPAVINSSGPAPVYFMESGVDRFKVSLPVAGIYYFTATAKNSNNETFTDTVAVVVLDRNTMDTMLRAKWNGMVGGLSNGDDIAASKYFSSDIREKYAANFDLLKDHLPEIASGLHDMQLIKITEDEAEYSILGDQAGQTFSFYLLFVKDADGIWRIRFF